MSPAVRYQQWGISTRWAQGALSISARALRKEKLKYARLADCHAVVWIQRSAQGSGRHDLLHGETRVLPLCQIAYHGTAAERRCVTYATCGQETYITNHMTRSRAELLLSSKRSRLGGQRMRKEVGGREEGGV